MNSRSDKYMYKVILITIILLINLFVKHEKETIRGGRGGGEKSKEQEEEGK